VIILAVAIFLLILSQGFNSYREGMFQAISIMTTTGFVTADFGSWHSGARIVLLALMFIGACGGSTGWGNKSSTGFNPDKTYEGNDEEGYFPESCDSSET